MENINFWVSLILAIAILSVLVGGICNRIRMRKGIGWQFIRYTVLGISVPTIALLALNNALSGEAATLLSGAMGFAFGKKGNDEA